MAEALEKNNHQQHLICNLNRMNVSSELKF
jgi:hypothetical protein